MKKQVKAIMLPTEDKDNLNNVQLGIQNNELYLFSGIHKFPKDLMPQHIYIISDDEIKEGDWCYFPEQTQDNLKVVQIEKFAKDVTFVIYGKGRYYEYANRGRKIIATNDRSLKVLNKQYFDKAKTRRSAVLSQTQLPNVSQSFLKAFVESDGKEDWGIEYEWSKENL